MVQPVRSATDADDDSSEVVDKYVPPHEYVYVGTAFHSHIRTNIRTWTMEREGLGTMRTTKLGDPR